MTRGFLIGMAIAAMAFGWLGVGAVVAALFIGRVVLL